MDAPAALERYLPHVNDAFTIVIGGAADEKLTLTKAKVDLENEAQTGFSLFFTSTSEAVLPQHIYRLHHSALGEFDLFLVPIQKKKAGIVYQAAFNLLTEEDQ